MTAAVIVYLSLRQNFRQNFLDNIQSVDAMLFSGGADAEPR